MKKKITINIDKELIKKLDKFAKNHYIDRTSAICILLSDALDPISPDEPDEPIRDDMETLIF